MRRPADTTVGALLALAVAGCGAASANPPASGLTGRVVAGPTCPVERVPPDPRCAPRPLAATLRITRADGRGPVVVAHSRADGRFRVRLAPGGYVIAAQARRGSPFPRPPAPLRARVHAGRYAAVTITYDTGIR